MIWKGLERSLTNFGFVETMINSGLTVLLGAIQLDNIPKMPKISGSQQLSNLALKMDLS